MEKDRPTLKTRVRVEDFFSWRPAWRSLLNPRGLYLWSRSEEVKLAMAEHQPLVALLLVLNLVTLIVTVILATVASVDNDNDVFERNLGVEANEEDTKHHVTPASWTFQIWIVIYLWQFIWIFYSLSLIFRVNKYTDGYLYVEPAILPAAFSGIFILHLTISITWLFTYDNQFYIASFVALASMTLTLYICTFFAIFLLWSYQTQLSVSEMWANIILVHNGLALYAAWSTVAMLLGLHNMLVEVFDVKSSDAATSVLSILLIIVIVYPVMEMWISKKRLRYVVTPYVCLIVAVAGMIDGQEWEGNADQAYSVLKIVILALLILATIAKMSMIVFRIWKNPTKIERSCRRDT